MSTNWKQLKAIEQRNKERILAVCPTVRETSGIYILTREENGFKYAYVGQAKKLLSRLAQHLSGYDMYIDLSLKKHGLKSEVNPTGWDIIALAFDESELNDKEREFIQRYANAGFQLRNVTSGGQDSGKTDINERKPARGYRDGVKQGERNVIKKIAHWFDKHLKADYKSDKPSKNAIKALDQFNQLIQGESDDE